MVVLESRTADYWIVKLGPIVDGQYQYSVVTDSRTSSLFILVRLSLLPADPR